MTDEAATIKRVLFLSSDLVFPSRVGGVVSRLGGQLKTSAGAAGLLSAAAEAPTPRLVLLDLTNSFEVADVVGKLKAIEPAPAVVAFGPHVHEAKLAAATEAGCDAVLTRGQFNNNLDAIVAKYL